jgi:hypothetical protein
MRAKFIKEAQNFERGIHPKQSLGIGGISLGEEKNKMKKKAEDDWNFFLMTILDGKTISAVMKRFPGDNQWRTYSVTVIEWNENEDDAYGAIDINGEDGYRYILLIDDKKIYIENAR